MTQFIFANNAVTTLAGPIAATATSLNLAAGSGVLFPQPAVGQQFAMTLVSQSDANVREIAYCTSRSGDTCTVLRGQEGTPATAFIAGDNASNDLTAGTTASFIDITRLQQQTTNYAVDVGSANTIGITLNPQPGSLALIAGTPIRVLVAATNTGATVMFITGLPPTQVVTQDGLALSANAIYAKQIYEFTYNPGVGFNVSSPFVIPTQTNTWAVSQIFANNTQIQWKNSGGTAIPVLSVDSANQTVIYAGSATSVNPFAILTASGQVGMAMDANRNFSTAGNFSVAGNFQTVGGNVVSAGSIEALSGNILANNGQLQASVGATGLGIPTAATLLKDFNASINNTGGLTDYIYQSLPSGVQFQVFGGITTTGADFITFPIAFPTTCFHVFAIEGNPAGWVSGTAPTIFGTQQPTRNSFALYAVVWNPVTKAFNFAAGATYRYVAFGV